MDNIEDVEAKEEQEESIFQQFIKSKPKLWFWAMVISIVVILILVIFYGKTLIITYIYESSYSDAIKKFGLEIIEGENFSYYSKELNVTEVHSEAIFIENVLFMQNSFIKESGHDLTKAIFFHSGNPLVINYIYNKTEGKQKVGNVYEKNEVPYVILNKSVSYEMKLFNPDSDSYCFMTIFTYNSTTSETETEDPPVTP